MPVAAAAASFVAGAVVLIAHHAGRRRRCRASRSPGDVPPLWMFIVGGCLGAALRHLRADPDAEARRRGDHGLHRRRAAARRPAARPLRLLRPGGARDDARARGRRLPAARRARCSSASTDAHRSVRFRAAGGAHRAASGEPARCSAACSSCRRAMRRSKIAACAICRRCCATAMRWCSTTRASFRRRWKACAGAATSRPTSP